MSLKIIFLKKDGMLIKFVRSIQKKSGKRVSVRHLKRFQEDNSMYRRAGSGRQRAITTEENENLTENLICLQEDYPGSQMSPREVEKNTGTSRTSERRMIKRRGLKQFKCLKATMISSGTQGRRTKRAGALVDRFRKSRSVEKCV